MTGQKGILFTILTCKTFNHRCTQIHVLFQRVKTERGMCRACCEGIQTPNALVPLTNATQFHLHSTRATPSNTHTHRLTTGHLHVYTLAQYTYIVSHISYVYLEPQPLYTPSTYTITSPNAHALTENAGKKSKRETEKRCVMDICVCS